jgi:hypothetical protein
MITNEGTINASIKTLKYLVIMGLGGVFEYFVCSVLKEKKKYLSGTRQLSEGFE